MNNETALTPTSQAKQLASGQWTREQIDLIKRTVAKGTTDDELALFLYVAKKTGLDPLAKQIHAVKRWSTKDGKEVMSIQTGIDGYRLTAERTGNYAPGREPSFAVDGQKLVSATAYIKKLVAGEWHEVAATAYFDEYVQKDKQGNPTPFWARMPKGQLAKCAEALALRRAFPAELSGVRTDEEMSQAENPVAIEAEAQEIKGGRAQKDPVPMPQPKEKQEFEVDLVSVGIKAQESKSTGKFECTLTLQDDRKLNVNSKDLAKGLSDGQKGGHMVKLIVTGNDVVDYVPIPRPQEASK